MLSDDISAGSNARRFPGHGVLQRGVSLTADAAAPPSLPAPSLSTIERGNGNFIPMQREPVCREKVRGIYGRFSTALDDGCSPTLSPFKKAVPSGNMSPPTKGTPFKELEAMCFLSRGGALPLKGCPRRQLGEIPCFGLFSGSDTSGHVGTRRSALL